MTDKPSENTNPEPRPVDELAGYEPPRVESKLTADDLEREALYAGNGISPIRG